MTDISEPGTRQVVHLSISSAQPIGPKLVAQVEQACARAEDLPGVTVVLRLTGGRPATTDTDLSIHTVNRWERALRRLERLDGVAIAVADGLCAGPALEALLAADYRIAGPDLLLRFSPEAGDPWPGMAVHRVANQLGVARARGLVLFGAEWTATTAATLGLIDEVTTELDEAVARRTAATRDLVGSELAIRRRLLMEASAVSFEDALGTHLAACDRTLRRMKGTQPA
ncbi:enoyl-CoA-hydratase DpgB [Verrucosispora sp. TAA-831]|uniref:enoyl-CoA-hydratase DpgB n=1 Tax=Verrucosispora sp. TAA-831 TaxID=3422227 RepID=UPI003D6E3F59